MQIHQMSINMVLLNPAKGYGQALGRLEVATAAGRGLVVGEGCAHCKENSGGKGILDLW